MLIAPVYNITKCNSILLQTVETRACCFAFFANREPIRSVTCRAIVAIAILNGLLSNRAVGIFVPFRPDQTLTTRKLGR